MLKLVLSFFTFILFSHFSPAAEDSFLTTPNGGDFFFSLTENHKSKLSDFKGKIVFLFFGFTHCPEVCPLTKARLLQLKSELEKKKVSDVQFLFLSVDQERDTPAVLSSYAKNMGPLFTAAAGSERELKEAMALYGGYFSKIKTASGKTIIDHSANVYVINQRGEWVDTIYYRAPFADYLKAYERVRAHKITREINLKRKLVKNLGINKECALQDGACSFFFSTPNKKEGLEISFSPRPVKTQKKMEIEVKTKGPGSPYTPIEIDFVGIDQNMGLIRPELKAVAPGSYKAWLELPLCEVEQMRWRVRLILKDSRSQYASVEFQLKTTE